MGIEHVTISRDDTVYAAFPDVVLTRAGKLLCVFMENTHHSNRDKARITIVESHDRGRTWSPRRYFSEPGTREQFFNCPRISRLPDDRLALTCDFITGPETLNQAVTFIWIGNSEGTLWNKPIILNRPGIMPDKLLVLADGRWLLALQTFNPVLQHWEQYLYISMNEGQEWSDRITISNDPRYSLCEASLMVLRDSTLVAFMRENSKRGYDGMKAFSRDGGETWSELCHTPLPGCHRPTAGYLKSGFILISYRFMQGGKGWFCHWSQNLFAAIMDESSVKAPERDDQSSCILPIDHDRAVQPDCGYSGWVQFEDGDIFIVNYIVDDAPLAQIRGYRLQEEDFHLHADL